MLAKKGLVSWATAVGEPVPQGHLCLGLATPAPAGAFSSNF